MGRWRQLGMGRRRVEVTSISIQIEKRKTLIFSAAALTPVVCVCVCTLLSLWDTRERSWRGGGGVVCVCRGSGWLQDKWLLSDLDASVVYNTPSFSGNKEFLRQRRLNTGTGTALTPAHRPEKRSLLCLAFTRRFHLSVILS